MKAFKYLVPALALSIAACSGGGAGSSFVPNGASSAIHNPGVTSAAKTNTNGNGVGNGCGNAGDNSGHGQGGHDNGYGNGACHATPVPTPTPQPDASPTPFASGTLNFSQDCTANFSVNAGGVVDETNRTTTGSNDVQCPELANNIRFIPGSGQPCPSVDGWGALVSQGDWTVQLYPGAAPIGDDELAVVFANGMTYTACHYTAAPPPPPPAGPTVTSSSTIAFGPSGCSATFASMSDGSVVETNRTAACGLDTMTATFVPAPGTYTATPCSVAGSYDASGDPSLQAANGGPFGTGTYNYCFYPAS